MIVEIISGAILLIFLFLLLYLFSGMLEKEKSEGDNNMLYDIKVKYHSKDIEEIEKVEIGDWIDLRAAKDYELKKGESALIDLGVSIKIPECCEAYLIPRSSTYKNFKIIQTNSFGLIDSSYCGEEDVWKMPVLAMEKTKISKNDRICQFRINPKMPPVRIIKVDKMEDDSRGGFGSTGIA